MILQVPALLFWFVPVAGVIIVLYLLKIRRREVRVPAIFLFPRITTDVRANSSWQRLRFNWLMVLQLLIALLLLTALARPMMKGHGISGRTVVFVLDLSASMRATDAAPDRFTEAKQRLRRWISRLGANDHAALITAGTEPRVAMPLSTDHKRVRSVLDRLRPTEAPSDAGAALRLAAALIANRPNSRLVFVSDGSFPEVTDFSPGKADLVYESVGKGRDNVGIVAMDAQRKGNRMMMFVALRNFGTRAMTGVLNLTAEGQLVNARELTLASGKAHGETVTLPASVRRVSFRWECKEDRLSSDNVAFWVGSGSQPVRVLLVGSGDYFLDRALALEPATLVDKAQQVPETERGSGVGGRYDVVVFDGVPPVPVKAKSVWLVNATDGSLVTRTGQTRQTSVVAWERENPLLKYVDMSSVLIDKAIKVQSSEWGHAVAEARETPLIVLGERGGKRYLYLGWQLADSDFPLRFSFPIFVANALRYLVGEQRWQQGFTLKAGMPVTLNLPAQSAELKRPDGSVQRLNNSPDRLFLLRDSEDIGVYSLTAGNTKTAFAVNLLNADESDIAPKRSITLGGRVIAAKTSTVLWRELWRLALIAGLLVMVGEWVVYVRRS